MRISIFSISLIFLSAGLLLSPVHLNAQDSDTERLNEWFDAKYEELLQMSPMRLTTLGRKDQYNKIDDMSIEAANKQLEWREETIRELEENFDYNSLEADAQVSWDLWVYQYELEKDAREFRHIDYVFEQMRGQHTRLPQFLINFHNVDNPSDMDAYISRIEGISRALRQLMERAYEQSEIDVHPPKFAYETVKREARGLITGAPFTNDDEKSPLWEDALAKIDTLHKAGDVDDELADNYKNQVREALFEHFMPAYEELITWVDNNIDYAIENPVGISRHPDGDEYYRYLLRFYTTTDLTPEEIHNIGLEEVERILEEMREIKREVEFEGTLDEFFYFIRTDDQFYYPDTYEGRQAYIDNSKEFLAGIEEQLPEFFGILPKAGLEVRRVEAFREQDGAPQHYMPGTPDGSRPGVYYAHLSDMGSMPKYEMEAIAYHEGNPGHHMQISIAQELESVPQFRTQERYGVYTEGWALYTEKLGPDTGFDSIDDVAIAKPLARLLDRLDAIDSLPKTVLYNLNPRDNELMATMLGNFQDGTVPGKLQHGPPWWFLDQKDGIEKQTESLANMGILSEFIGMTTDSRSFLSFSRHEYFRRIMCNIIGDDVEKGLVPNDEQLLYELIEKICYRNARDYFNYGQP